MTQGQEVPTVQQKPSLTEIVHGWNLVTDNIKPLALYLAAEDILTMGEVGAVEEAMDVISNVLRANLKMHNERFLKETARREEAEKGIRAKLEAAQEARDAEDHGEVIKTIKVDSKKNDPPADAEPDDGVDCEGGEIIAPEAEATETPAEEVEPKT